MVKDHLISVGEAIIGAYISPVSSAYKKAGLLPSHHRLRMCQIAVENSDWVMVDPWESLSETYVPTLNVLKHVRDCIEEGLNRKGLMTAS